MIKADLVILVPDKNTRFALNAALKRPDALGIRPIAFKIIVHSGRDGGVRSSGAELLRTEKNAFVHALIVHDFEGSGAKEADPMELEKSLDASLLAVWGARSKAIVAYPEMDMWMWGSDNKLKQVLNWTRTGDIRDWVKKAGFELDNNDKPLRPKEAIEHVMSELRLPRSSAVYGKIASEISLARCHDAAFQRLRRQLQKWFPQ